MGDKRSPGFEHIPTTNTGDEGVARASKKAEEALGVLDGLVSHLQDVETLRETIGELLVDNRRYRSDNIRLAKALVERGDDSGDLLKTLQASQEKARVHQQQVRELIDENAEISTRLVEVEELNGSMMSMYVSSFQLHATLDVDEVVRVIEEIVVNFIGASSYAILMSDEGDTFRVVGQRELDGRLPEKGISPRGVLAEIIGGKTAYVHTSNRAAREGVLAAVPLAMGNRVVGAVMIFGLLSQKERLLPNDIELLSLLGGHAASALISAQLYARADRKLKTLEGMIDLLGGGD
jgi:hypothetical protein